MIKLQFNADADTWKAQETPPAFTFQAIPCGFMLYNEDLSLTVLASPVLSDRYEAVVVLTQEGVINDVIDRVVAPAAQIATQVQTALAKHFQDGDEMSKIRPGIRPYQGANVGGREARQ